TALPPEVAAWWLVMLHIVPNDEGSRSRLHERTRFFRQHAASRGIALGGNDFIATLLLKTNDAAVAAACQLQEVGFDIRAIRPPTVPIGTARLRISIHADHDPTDLRNLAGELASLM